jgi:hypothetical protein
MIAQPLLCHCEDSEAIPFLGSRVILDRRVASLLAMTAFA